MVARDLRESSRLGSLKFRRALARDGNVEAQSAQSDGLYLVRRASSSSLVLEGAEKTNPVSRDRGDDEDEETRLAPPSTTFGPTSNFAHAIPMIFQGVR